MVTGELKSKIDSLWEIFWTGGLTNPLDVIEQMTYLMFIHDLDDSDNLRAREAAMLGLPYESIFAKEVQIGDRTIDGSQLKFTKTGHGGTDKVWFYDMKADGYSLDDKRGETKENDIPDIIARFHHLSDENDRKRTEQSFFVPKDEIVANDYDLSINKYKKTEYKAVEYPPASEIMANIRNLESRIAKEMDELERLLRK